MISGLIALVVATFLWVAYRRVEATLERTSGERAQGAADQIANLLDGQRTTEQLQQLRVDPDLRRFLKTRTDDAREAARARLAALSGTAPRRVELWDGAGSRLLEVVRTGIADGRAIAKALPPAAAPSAGGIGALQGSADTVFTDTVVEILDDAQGASPPVAPARRLGYLLIRSTFVETPPGIFSRLVGRDAAVRIGNRTERTWTDFSRLMPAPALDLKRPGVTQYRAASGELRLGAVSLIHATPWAAWVEFPLADVLAPARRFLTEMIVVALVFVIGAAVLTTVLAARITMPLSAISSASAAIAAGDYSPRITTERRDEIGQLARTFNVMVEAVKAASAALRTSEESYRRLFAGNPHPMWVYDVETLRFLEVNDMATLRYGYSKVEFLGMTIKDLRPEREIPALLDNISQVGSAVAVSGIWKHRKKDGELIDVEISSHELVLEGRPARAVLAHDVTDSLRSARALQESEALFRGMAETMPHIVWTARPDGERTYYNRRWFDYTGLSPTETHGPGWQSALHPDDRQRVIARWSLAIRTGDPHDAAYRLKGADGAYRWQVGRAAPLRNEGGAIAMWVGTITDVEDTRRDQETLKTLNTELEQRVHARTAQLQAANQELESFSYSVSHDLRAPLRHVQGYVELVAAATAGQLSEKAQRYLKTISCATLEMGELIDGLLAFSRLGQAQISEGVVSLDALVQDTIRGLEMATRGRHIVWRTAALPPAIGDPSLLKQVFANLIGNAVKYSSQRDPAEIEIGCAGEEDGRAILFVRDNGAGFDMSYAHKLFGVFQRLHRADEFEGTGIGLAIVRRIIARHGGRTWAEGEIDKGATVFFTLQLRRSSR
jgi:PAS domain S-box-containing protein